MVSVNENSLEWSIKHLVKFYLSDFYPRPFEINAIQHNWPQVKAYILSLDLTNYTPKPPQITLAPKPNCNFRVVHQLDLIDSLVYTSLVYEISAIIESFRIPKTKKIACSYRIKPDTEGSFFDKDDAGWENFTSKTEELIAKYHDNYVLICDIADFYNQIYIHQIRNLISEAGKGKYDEQARVLEDFLLSMNNKNSKGIPVGPAASILLAELIMADIDNKILGYTEDFVRWVDDIRIFFKTKEEAIFVLHELTHYLYINHRLVFSGEKTTIKSAIEFEKRNFKNKTKLEQEIVLRKTEELAFAKMEEFFSELPPYNYYEAFDEDVYSEIFAKISQEKQFSILSGAYYDLLVKTLESDRFDSALLRHILRKASRYRIRSILPIVLNNFEKLIPIIREVVIYLNNVINEGVVMNHKADLNQIFRTHFSTLPYVNIWLSYLLQNECFNKTELPEGYGDILNIRNQALIAFRKKDITWVKSNKEKINDLGPWDRRAIIFSSLLLSKDEMRVWLKSVTARGDIIDKSIASYLVSIKKDP